MAGRNRKGKIFALFKDDFKITFFYKPSMELDDIFYVLILDDLLKLKLNINGDTLIIDDIIPLTEAYLASTCDTLIHILKNQKISTVLISLLGNTQCIHTACMKHNVPIVEDDRYITVSKPLYDRFKQYYQNDSEKYGFYLLSVREEDTTKQIGCTTPVTTMKSMLLSKYDIVNYEENKELHTTKFEVKGISFELDYSENDHHYIFIKQIDISNINTYIDLLELFELFEKMDFSPYKLIVYGVQDSNVYQICNLRRYPKVSLETESSNRAFLQSTFGNFLIYNGSE